MKCDHYFHHCSKEYIETIDSSLISEVVHVISKLPTRQTQAEINRDLWWLLTDRGWSYDTAPAGLPESPPNGIDVKIIAVSERKRERERSLCRTSTTIDAKWHADFGRTYVGKLVQMEAQFGTVESMFKDFCGFRIANYEKRLALGIEIVMSEPNVYFAHRKGAVTGMAYFEVAKKTLPAIGLDCPIWLIGIRE
ncbi:MAG: hypothetical protein WC899_10760 [bacterium]|jgi:hypothetical protein